MKQDWVEWKLGDILSLEYGKPLPKEDRSPDGLYPAYGANGIKTKTDKFLVDSRSIIVGRKGSAGEIHYTEDKFWALDVTYYAKFDRTILDLDFLFYLLSSLKLPKLAKGVKPGINRNDVYAIIIQLPPLQVQKQIVAKLDQAFAAINTAKINIEKNLENAKEIFQSKLNEIFSQKGEGWELQKLESLYDITSSKRVHKSDWKDKGIPFYRAREVVKLARDGYVENDLFISPELYSEFTSIKGEPKEGDILVSAVGTLGQCYLIKENEKLYFKDASVLWFRKTSTIESKYIEYAFKSKLILDQVMEGSMGAVVGTYTITRAKNTEVLVTHIEQQKKIVNELDSLQEQTQSLESKYQQELNSLEELQESILKKALEGEL